MENAYKRIAAELDGRPINEEVISESVKSQKHKLNMFITKAEYILEHDGDEMGSKEKKQLKEVIGKVKKIYNKAEKSSTDDEAKQIYKQGIKEIKPYTNNKSFLKFLKDFALFDLFSGLITSVAGGIIGGVAGTIGAAHGATTGDENDAVYGASAGARLGLTAGAGIGLALGTKAVKEVNHEGRKSYLKKAGKKSLKEEYFNY
jgi:hypothetical protein